MLDMSISQYLDILEKNIPLKLVSFGISQFASDGPKGKRF